MNLLIFFVLYLISRFPSNNHHAKIYTLSINYSKNSSLLRGNGWGKNGSIEICPVVAARNNIVTTQDTPRSRRRVAHRCIVTESASLHPCSLRVPPYIYTSLASIVTLQPRWICRSVLLFFFLLFSNLSPFAASKSAMRFFASLVDNSKFLFEKS